MQKIVMNISDIVSGKTEALDVLQTDDTLQKMYISMSSYDTSDFLRHLGHTKPKMRVLEIFSGTGASTLSVIKAITLPGSVRHTVCIAGTLPQICPLGSSHGKGDAQRIQQHR